MVQSMVRVFEKQIGRQKLILETGRMAFQASGAVQVRYGDTVALVTATMSKSARPDIDFLPLTVEFEERLYAVGKIPGSFFRREGRPTSEAVLSARLIDRPMRPLFPKSLHNDLQIVVTVLSGDRQNPPDVLGIVGASASVSISDIPFNGPVGACRVAYKDGQFIVNPTYEEIEASQLSVVVAGARDSVGMVEAGATEVSEEVVIEAIKLAKQTNNQVIDLIEEMAKSVGKAKQEAPPEVDKSELEASVREILGNRLVETLERAPMKSEREEAIEALRAEAEEALKEKYDAKAVAGVFKSILKDLVRSRILERGVRPDGRKSDEIRPISIEVGLIPRTHGSALFTRGQTQVLSLATLASIGMEQKLDTLSPQETKRYLHHYNFPPYSVGETGRMFTGRREIGHGALAERAIEPMLPDEEEFPYAIRVVSEVVSSNGSTSMASVCGSTLSLMDAGVPMKAPVAGIAMGLIMGEDGKHAVLTDIQGIEDFLGDMDFKVAGTSEGISALQMDMKIQALPDEILMKALEQARVARLFILDKMKEALPEPRPTLSQYAPKMYRMTIPIEKIGAVIGPGGKNIRAIIEESGATVDIDDKGVVVIGAVDDASIQKARARIEGMTRELQIGDIFTGKVTRTANFGVFVELLPGKDGLLRREEMSDMDNGYAIGQEVTVMIHEIDSMGRVNLSRRALFEDKDKPRPVAAERTPGGDRGFDRGPRSGYGGGRDRGPSYRDRDSGPRDFGSRGGDRGPRYGGGDRGGDRGPDRGPDSGGDRGPRYGGGGDRGGYGGGGRGGYGGGGRGGYGGGGGGYRKPYQRP